MIDSLNHLYTSYILAVLCFCCYSGIVFIVLWISCVVCDLTTYMLHGSCELKKSILSSTACCILFLKHRNYHIRMWYEESRRCYIFLYGEEIM